MRERYRKIILGTAAGSFILSTGLAVYEAVKNGTILSPGVSQPSKEVVTFMSYPDYGLEEAPASPTFSSDSVPAKSEQEIDPPVLQAENRPTVMPVTVPDPKPAITAVSLFDKLMNPLVAEAENREQEWRKHPLYNKLIDWDLNKGRVNFLLFGYGETYEPPFRDVNIIGSQTILSYDINKKIVHSISWTHDLRGRNIELYLQAHGVSDVKAIKVDQAYATGGFELQREIGSSISGLAIHYQMVLGDDALVDLINSVLGKIKVDVSKDFRTNPFYFRGKKYTGGEFKKGLRELDGVSAAGFIKAVVIEVDPQHSDPQLEHNIRKPLVMAGIRKGLEENKFNPLVWMKTADFLRKALENKQVAFDFDPSSLLIDHFQDFARELVIAPFNGTSLDLIPGEGKNLYIVDKTQMIDKSQRPAIRWVKGDPNPVTHQDIARGRYPDPNMEIPYNADPYAQDLIRGYWKPVRDSIRSFLIN